MVLSSNQSQLQMQLTGLTTLHPAGAAGHQQEEKVVMTGHQRTAMTGHIVLHQGGIGVQWIGTEAQQTGTAVQMVVTGALLQVIAAQSTETAVRQMVIGVLCTEMAAQ